jgi:hypothetical protein
MAKRSFMLAPDEQAVLDRLTVRLLQPNERARFDALLVEHHYLSGTDFVGEQLRYIAEVDGQWLALFVWTAPAYHLAARDTWIGWSVEQRRRRLHWLANNARFALLSAAGRYPNLATRALALCSARLSADWQAAYGHPVLLVESFVDTQLFRGTAYKAAGWQALGATAGFARVSQDFYVAHDRPKALYLRPLHKRAAAWLRALQLPAALLPHEADIKPRCAQSVDELGSLWEHLRAHVPETRHDKGLRHQIATVLALTLASLAAGRKGGYRQAALFAADLNQRQRQALRCWFNARTGRYEVPGENCFYRVLSAVDILALGSALVTWQTARLGLPGDPLVVIDGKKLNTTGGPHLVGAYAPGAQRWLELEPVADKSNEIPAARTLLDRLDLDGKIALLDALHTQVETARQIVQAHGGHYVLVVKGNQPGLQQQAATLVPARAFPPASDHAGKEQRPLGTAGFGGARRQPGTNGFPSRATSGPAGAEARRG